AYKQYRAQVEKPWDLICVGAGPLKSLLKDQAGIEDVGFFQPADLPAFLKRRATAFVLPSRKEPWGVVVQEAAASRLPLICSDACGATVHLLQDGYNGFLFETGNVSHLVRCMTNLTALTPEARGIMGQRSYELSKQFTPQLWAQTLTRGLQDWNSTR
ncbi:MAG TPA: glycosyltransferase family 4 protein, partial [Abditibacteriaceae bacterium]